MSALASDLASLLNASACQIHVVDMEQAAKMMLPARYTPTHWEHNQYAVELWLRRAIENSRWRVKDVESADLIFAAANLSMWCVIGKAFSRRRLWDAAFHPELKTSKSPLDHPVLPQSGPASALPVFVARQFEGTCGPAENGKRLPQNLLLLQDEVSTTEVNLHARLVSPFVVSKPPWLVRATTPPDGPPPPWASRKLIFSAGHIPKLYIRDTRYMIWRQLRRDPRATVLSPTLYCTVGGFEACRRPHGFLRQQNTSYFTSFCRHACEASMSLGGSAHRVRTFCLAMRRGSRVDLTPILRNELKTKCRQGYRGVNFSDELGEMRRDTRRVPHPEYLRLAMSHKFCLITPGDFVSTYARQDARPSAH